MYVGCSLTITKSIESTLMQALNRCFPPSNGIMLWISCPPNPFIPDPLSTPELGASDIQFKLLSSSVELSS